MTPGALIETAHGLYSVTAWDRVGDPIKGDRISAVNDAGTPWTGRWLEDCQLAEVPA